MCEGERVCVRERERERERESVCERESVRERERRELQNDYHKFFPTIIHSF